MIEKVKIISQSATINDVPCELHIEMESIGGLPIEQEGLLNGSIRRFWTNPPIRFTPTGPVVDSTLAKDEQE